MTITSQAFANGETIPTLYTCDGDAINPPLEISNVPAGAQSLALIVDDPDAPSGLFDHWLVADIDPKITEVSEGATPPGAVVGLNGANQIGFIAPCPPSGIHHYHFQLFALNKKLDLEAGFDRDDLAEAMKGTEIAHAELVGTYSPEYPRE